MTFEPPDHDRFKSLGLAHLALQRGGTTPSAMNAANEVAVQAFLEGEIPFNAITEVVSDVVTNHASANASALDDVLADANDHMRHNFAQPNLSTLPGN